MVDNIYRYMKLQTQYIQAQYTGNLCKSNTIYTNSLCPHSDSGLVGCVSFICIVYVFGCILHVFIEDMKENPEK